MKALPIIMVLASLVMLNACTEENVAPNKNTPNTRAMTVNEEVVISASNNFAFDIYNRLNEAQPADNLFISPFSVSAALSMVANGAEGETREQIVSTLNVNSLTNAQLNEAYKGLVEYLYGLDNTVELEIANSNWLKDELTLNEQFKSDLDNYYEAEIQSLDFSAPSSVDVINNWIAQKTNDKIKNMLDQIPSDAVMYLINAIYFKAQWQYKFEKSLTAPANFHTPDGTIQTDMMHSEGTKVKYTYTSDGLYTEIPYGNGQYQLSVYMPNEIDDFGEVVQNLTVDSFDQLSEDSDSASVELIMPKFKIEYKKMLNDVLNAMGMVKAFSDDAELTSLIEESLQLYVSRVIHQSFIEVNEDGSEAAAATVVEVGLTSAGPGMSKPKTITLNKPFAFFIIEKHSQTILFAGKLMNPEE